MANRHRIPDVVHRSGQVSWMKLPTIPIGGLQISRLMVGGNPFSGHSHQNAAMTAEMLDYYTAERICAVLARCEELGVNTFIGRADAHIVRVLREYHNAGGTIQWLAQTAPEMLSLERNIRQAVANGAAAVYLHGGWFEQLWAKGDFAPIEAALKVIRELGVPAGVAGHDPGIHLEAAERLELDFQMVCCFNCGSVHAGRGERFELEDFPIALDAIARIGRPCIAYKVLGAGRFDPAVQLPEAYRRIKPSDGVLLGFFPKHQPTQIEDTVALVERILSEAPAVAGE